MRSVRVIAPAKINWTLEVLGKRSDGYHEIRSVMQTIFPWDSVLLELADEITLSVKGATRRLRDEPSNVRARARDIEKPDTNIAYRAAVLLRERSGTARGVHIHIDKHIPIAAGLGGGSSDAAAVLRGLREMWSLDISDDELAEMGAELGSDVPFFIRGGSALVSGRGDIVEHLPDTPQQEIVIRPPRWVAPGEKTAAMYAALDSQHYSDGSRTEGLAARVRSGEPVREQDICNAFEGALPRVDPRGADILSRAGSLGVGSPHLCGSGPSFFFLRDSSPAWRDWSERNVAKLRELGQTEIGHTLAAHHAQAYGHG
jgi:4-diphosphocytidyl-2-C-methyl-D-erythritol kinase